MVLVIRRSADKESSGPREAGLVRFVCGPNAEERRPTPSSSCILSLHACMQIRRPHSLKRDKGIVEVKDGYFRAIISKSGNKVETDPPVRACLNTDVDVLCMCSGKSSMCRQ